MYLPIPFTLGKCVQSDSTTVLKTRAPYCHHHHSASADSTEYWTWNGPEDGGDVQEDAEDVVTEEAMSYSPPVMDHCSPPRLEQNERFDDAPSFDLEILSNSHDSGSSDEASYSFSSDLPSESFSPLLHQDMVYASSLPDSPIGGLGLLNLTRNNRPFDGLGLVRIHSGRQRGEEQDQEDEDELSSTFLHDLEAMFLVKDYEVIEAPTIRVGDSPTMEEQLVAPPGSPVTASPARNSLTSKIKHALRPRGPSTPSPASIPTSALPTSISCTTVSASTSTSSTTSVSSTSSFIRRTCSAFRSQYNLNALRAEHALRTESPSTSPVKRTKRTEDSKRTGFLQPVDRASQPVPLTGPTRKVSVSVSMGEGTMPVTPVTPTITPITPGGKRSLQTHSVRDSKDWKDVRDLSVLGTISSGLKKRERK